MTKHAKLVFHFLFIPILIAIGGVQEEGLAVNESELRVEYSKMCSDICTQLRKLLEEPPTNAIVAISTAGRIRCAEARRLLLDNLVYPALPYIDDVPFVDNKRLRPAVYGIGYRHYEDMYPALASLESIGCVFTDFAELAPLYDERLMRDAIFTMLGVRCAGNYFEKIANKKISSGEKFPVFCDKPARLPLPKHNWMVTRNLSPDVVSRYDKIQATLLLRFSTELPDASPNLLDTIATMGFIRSIDAIPVLADNLTICPQVSTNAPCGFVFPAAEALIAIGPAIGDCFAKLKATKPLSVEEALWLRISHELYPEGLEYELYCAAQTNDVRAARLMQSLPWRRLTDEDCAPISSQSP